MRKIGAVLNREIIDFVNGYFDTYKKSPSIRDIEAGVSASRSTIQRYLAAMQESGEIEYDGYRGIITKEIQSLLETRPVEMGSSIPCGPLTEVGDAELVHIRLPEVLTGQGEFFLLRASGTSMINAGIDDGDLVLIKRQTTARKGQIVAALCDGSTTTLKRYEPVSASEVHLVPENDALEPIVLKGWELQSFRIQGVAEKVIKNLN